MGAEETRLTPITEPTKKTSRLMRPRVQREEDTEVGKLHATNPAAFAHFKALRDSLRAEAAEEVRMLKHSTAHPRECGAYFNCKY